MNTIEENTVELWEHDYMLVRLELRAPHHSILYRSRGGELFFTYSHTRLSDGVLIYQKQYVTEITEPEEL